MELPGYLLKMHEVAVAATSALPILILPARGLAEICDWRKLGNESSAVIEPPGEALQRSIRIRLAEELDVDVTTQMLADIVAHVHFVYFSVS